MKIRMIIAAVAASCVLFQPAHAQDECASKVPLRPTAAVKTLPDKNAPKPAATTTGAEPEVFQLKDPVYVHVTGLKEFLDENECRKAKNLAPRKLVLFLDGSSMKGLVGTLVEPPQANILRFYLDRTEENKAAWAPILVNPSTEPREKKLSVGIEDQYPFESDIKIRFRSLPQFYFGLGLTFSIVLMILFLYLVYRTNICREGSPKAPAGVSADRNIPINAFGPFSLSKLQGALWFFIILASYMVIVAVTFDINGSFNATALTLLGIGAATVVGAAAIQNNPAVDPAARDPMEVAKDLDAQITDLEARLKTAPEPDRRALQTALRDTQRAYKRATNQSINIFTDIMSDANGVNFHRFQMVAWTLVLGVIFAETVRRKLAMPDFDNTVLGLMGLSAGTYLGLKITEPKTPDIPPAPKK